MVEILGPRFLQGKAFCIRTHTMFSETPLIRECGWTHQDSYMLEESVLDSPGLRDLLKKIVIKM